MTRLAPSAAAVVIVLAVLAGGNLAAGSPRDEKPKPKMPIGKDTTVVDGPLDKDGYIDYEAALNARLGKGITPERNACAGLWAALGPRPDGSGRGMPAGYFKTLGIAEPAAEGKYFVDEYKFVRELNLGEEERTTLHEQFSRTADGPWVARDFPQVAVWLAANEKPLALVHEAAKRPEYFQPTCSHRDTDPSSHLTGKLNQPSVKIRELVGALIGRAMLRMGERRFEEAWQDLMTCHRLGRHLMRVPTLTESLIGIAIDAVASRATLAWLGRADPSAERARVCMAEWGKLAPPMPLADMLNLGERLSMLDMVQMVRRGKGLSFFGATDPGPKNLERLDTIDWAPALKEVNSWFDRQVEATREPDRVKRERLFDSLDENRERVYGKKSAEEKLTDLFGDGFQKRLDGSLRLPPDQAGKVIALVLLDLWSAVRKVQEAFDRVVQTRQNLSLAFALHAFKKDNGKFPATLAELAPKYHPKVPEDLFSGRQLVYKSDGKSYTFYSVGVNGKDDGGRTYQEYGPGDVVSADDLVVRMPQPAVKADR